MTKPKSDFINVLEKIHRKTDQRYGQIIENVEDEDFIRMLKRYSLRLLEALPIGDEEY